jgi:hypothetical protein
MHTSTPVCITNLWCMHGGIAASTGESHLNIDDKARSASCADLHALALTTHAPGTRSAGALLQVQSESTQKYQTP